jgi:Rrf2 family transcriptional regulator, iron-sulfur cluster assembly transcription factor
MLSLTLTSTAEYALRAMSCLALLEEEQALNASELAVRTGVPQHYLNKVMRKLVQAGLAHAARGHGGGFRLAKPAKRITYQEILEVAGYEKRSDSCVFGWGKCRDSQPCPMHESWKKLNESFVTWAHATSLQEVREYAAQSGADRKLHLPPTVTPI